MRVSNTFFDAIIDKAAIVIGYVAFLDDGMYSEVINEVILPQRSLCCTSKVRS